MERSIIKKGILLVIGLCIVLLFGAAGVQYKERQNEKHPAKEKKASENDRMFRGLASYEKGEEGKGMERGEAYGSCGMYYQTQDGCLHFLDAASGKETVVCTRKGCEHKMDRKAPTGCEADFNQVAAFVPSGDRLYYIPSASLKEDAPWEIWKQDTMGGGQKKIIRIWEKKNTNMVIQGMQCDGMRLVVAFQELGYYDKNGTYKDYGAFGQKGGIYIIKLEDWSYQRVYITSNNEDEVLGKQADMTVNALGMASEEVRVHCTYYDKGFHPEKYKKLPEKKGNQYRKKHTHQILAYIKLSDGSVTTVMSFDNSHSFVFSGDWHFNQDYCGNLTGENQRSGDYTMIYSSPATEKEKECDSGYEGITATNESIFYIVRDKKTQKGDWYQFDLSKERSKCIAQSVYCIPEYSVGDYIYAKIFRKDGRFEHRAILIRDLEKGSYQF